MNVRQRAKKAFDSLVGVHLLSEIPIGVDFAYDVGRSLPGYRMEVVFDVGANIGQSAKQFSHWWPKSRIYAFEPVSSTFEILKENLDKLDNVTLANIAIGSSAGFGQIVITEQSGHCHLLDEVSEAGPREQIQRVEVETVDNYCQRQGIEHIGFLKIDAEGHDLQVLDGASRVLAEGRVDFIQVEAGMSSSNKFHIPFEEFKQYLEAKDYLLFGIYDQVHPRMKKKAFVRRADLVFVSRALANE
jgi:FkbM family methyltransferase